MDIPKRALKKYLYEFRVPLTYKKTMAVVEACLKDEPFQKKVDPYTILQIKRALESYRKTEGKTSQSALNAEISLLERAAEMGNNSAISLLCGSRLAAKDCTKEDWKDGSNLLKQLMDQGFPLAFKVSGDLAYGLKQFSHASNFYSLAIEKGLEDQLLKTECYRNLGHIYFKEGHLLKSLHNFNLACSTAPDQRQVADCHFYMAQLCESNRESARKHLEVAATYGLSDAFVPLGMLLLNYFNEPSMAKQWIKLGLVLDKTGEAAVGLFDVGVRLKDSKLIRQALAAIRKHPESERLLELRKHTLSEVLPTLDSDRAKMYPPPNPQSPGRWGV